MNLRILSAASACMIGFVSLGCGDAERANRPPEAPPAVAGVPSRLPSEPDEVPARSREKSASRPAPKREPELKRLPPIEYYRTNNKFDPHGRFYIRWKGFKDEQDVFGQTDLHERAVYDFISRPGIGVGRGLQPTYLSQQFTELVYLNEVEQSDPKPNELIRPKYNSNTKMATLPDGSKRIMRELDWQIISHQLMSVDTAAGPGVYLQTPGEVHDNKSNKVATAANTPKRKLDDFETEALERLRKGEDVAVQLSPERMRMLGAIRSDGFGCRRCHDVQGGTLLGAFTYEFRLKADEKPAADGTDLSPKLK